MISPPPHNEIRPLVSGDRPALESFSCKDLRRVWTADVEYMIQEHLADNIDGGYVDSLGIWLDGQLSGVIAWRLDDDPRFIRSSVLGVRYGAQRRGLGRRLKEELLARASEEGIQAVISRVHRDNDAMLNLNAGLGARCFSIPNEPSYLECVVPVHA